MVCEGCASSDLALKTVRWRSGERRFALCDPCWEPLSGFLWVVVGPVPAHGRCRSCGHWFGLQELAGISPGGKWDAPSGLCGDCSSTTP
ncbi:MAG: hypothetical protein M3R38_05490 [Actinomycetota bacterium]|nr:hypothetical protein [Actinomycetota bacterium]